MVLKAGARARVTAIAALGMNAQMARAVVGPGFGDGGVVLGLRARGVGEGLDDVGVSRHARFIDAVEGCQQSVVDVLGRASEQPVGVRRCGVSGPRGELVGGGIRDAQNGSFSALGPASMRTWIRFR